MPTFGFSAFLKIASLNPKPQRTELRKRLLGGSGTPYDFHRGLKLAAGKYVLELEDMPSLLATAKDIKQLPERKSFVAGLQKLESWRGGVSGLGYKVSSRTYESPSGLFKIAVQPNFGIVHGPDSRVAYHVWNTKKPELSENAVYATLSILPGLYADELISHSNFGLLSLREPRLYLLSEKPGMSAAFGSLVAGLEKVIEDIYDEIGGPPLEDTGDYPIP